MEKIKRSVAILLAVIVLASVITEMNFVSAANTTVATGNYIFKNVETGECLTLKNNRDSDNVGFIMQKRKSEAVNQVIKIKKKDDNYLLQPAESTTRFISAPTSSSSDNKVFLSSDSKSIAQCWSFSVTIMGEYVIKSAADSSLALTASSNGATVKKYKEGDESQRWKLVPFELKKSGDSEGVYAYGVDVSNHNGDINWQAVKEYGISFAIIRVGYGMDQEDQDDLRFKANADACQELGIPFGVYIYSYADSIEKAKSEARHCLRLVSGYNLSLPIYYDLEDPKTTAKCSESKILKMSKAFAQVIAEAGYETGFYSSTNWWRTRLTDSYYDSHSRWVAQYYSECTYEGTKDMWQYTSEGKIPGMPGYTDLNALYYPLDENVSEVVYTGEEITPDFTVTGPNGKILEKNKDYTVSWRDNVNVGTAYADIVGINSYEGFTKTKKFKIVRRSIVSADFTQPQNRVFTGIAIEPTVKATYNGKKLVKDKDYTVTYKNNIKSGTATITVKGLGNFKGTKTIEFKILRLSIKNATVTGLENKTYTGSRLGGLKFYTPSGLKLVKDKHYTVTYKNNREIGKATATVKGIGDCSGTYNVSFKIVPKTPQNLRAVKKEFRTISLKWDRSNDGTYYRLYRSTDPNGKYELIYAGKDNSYRDTGLKSGTVYFYKVRASKTVSGERYYSYASDTLKISTRIGNTDFTVTKNTSEGTAKVKLEKKSGATGYAIYRYVFSTGEYVKVYQGTDTRYTIENLKKGYIYRVAVRTYKDTKYGRIYSNMSEKKAVKL